MTKGPPPGHARAMDETPPASATPRRARLIGVVAPATNITTQPELDDLRPRGVINAHARIPNPDRVVTTDADQRAVRAAMVAGLGAALDTLAPARPDHAILAVMVEHFVGGGEAGERLVADAAARLGCPVTVTTEAMLAALAALGARRVALLSPFLAEGHRAAARFLEEAGLAVVRSEALAIPGPAAIAHVPEERLREAVRALDAPEVEAIVQVGTNLPFARVAVAAEAALGKPVLAANPTTYWRALRRAGITDRRDGAGVLFARA